VVSGRQAGENTCQPVKKKIPLVWRVALGGLCAGSQRANSGIFIGFLEELRKRFGRILVYLDNAGYHKSTAVKKYLDDQRGDVVLRYLPPYMPELNPVEIQWRMIRKGTGNRLYGNTEEINESIRACWITVRSDPSR